ERLRLLRIDRFLGALVERLEVAHAQEAGDEPRRVELLQVVDLLADADEDHRPLHRRHRGQGAAALRGPVELRDDDARDPDRVVERLRLRPRLLTDRRVEDEEAFIRLDGLGDALDLGDQVRLERMPARRVHDDYIAPFQGLDPRLGDLHGFLRPRLLVDDSDDMLARAHARGRLLFERPPLELLRDREGELDVHVRLDERPLDVPDDLFDERLIDVTGARDLAERFS